MKKRNNKGFTLVELLAVIVILAIIMIIAIPSVLTTMSTARKKTFEEFGVKSLNEAEKKTLNLQLLGDSGVSNCEIYSIKDDLGLSNTGDYKGFVLIKKKGTEIDKWIVLWNNDMMLLPYDFNNKVNYYGESKELIDSIEQYDESKKELLTAASLCGLGCESCSYHEEVVEATCTAKVGDTIEYDYTGGEEIYTAPCDGHYKLETWGAEGGSALDQIGGYGAYSTGIIKLNKGEKIYINVGGKGADAALTPSQYQGYEYAVIQGGYNGGGSGITGQCAVNIRYSGGGGGATSISFISGLLKTQESSKNNVIMVAGSGGGAHIYKDKVFGNGANGGGITGNSPTWTNVTHTYYVRPTGGTQTSGGTTGYSWDPVESNFSEAGSFGQGANYNGKSCGEGAGSGGGYYGGASGQHTPGSGGSSYIGNTNLSNKTMYCVNCEESNEASTKTISTTCVSNTATSNCAKTGNGYTRIKYMGRK